VRVETAAIVSPVSTHEKFGIFVHENNEIEVHAGKLRQQTLKEMITARVDSAVGKKYASFARRSVAPLQLQHHRIVTSQ
jgi:hypothetical protein